MDDVKVFLGPPGTGKTTRLLNLVDEALSAGVEPDKIGFISFTKKSVNEAKDRAAERFQKPESWFSYFRTIHSLSFRQLGMTKNQVMGRNQYIELGDIMGMKMTGIHRQDQMVYDMPIGDQMVFIESLSRLMCQSLEKTWNMLNSDISYHELDYFQRTLMKYKKANMLYDFTDMLERYHQEGYKPELDVLFVDESQDLCALQWRIVEDMIKNTEKTYIAGDDDQAIFRWSGADIDYFLSLTKMHDNEVLSQSYRLPRKIHAISKTLTAQIHDRSEKEYAPKDSEGDLQWVSQLDDISMESGQWLILVRNGFMIRDIVESIRQLGYPYQTVYYSVTEDPALQAALVWEQLRKGEEVSVLQVAQSLSYIHRKNFSLQRFSLGTSKEERITMRDLISRSILTMEYTQKIWHEALDKISFEDREYFIAVRRRKESLVGIPRIKIGTIHGAKGSEAENVVVFTDISRKTYNAMMENYDDELRVFYVAVTRSSNHLFIVQPQTRYYFTI